MHVKPGQNGIKCVWERVDIYKVYKAAVCSYMKKVTHLQWFQYLANFRNSKYLKKLAGMSAYDFS